MGVMAIYQEDQAQAIDYSLDYLLGNPEIPCFEAELVPTEKWESSEDKNESGDLTEIFK